MIMIINHPNIINCSRKFRYLGTFDLELCIRASCFVHSLNNYRTHALEPGTVLLRKCNYLIQEKASLVFVSCMKRVDRKLGLVPGKILAL